MEERYEIQGKIGQGGLGVVYRGYDLLMNRDVAIKRIFKLGTDLVPGDEATRSLIKEAEALASVRHPNIVTICDLGMDEDGFYIVMELLSGKTLEELVQRRPFEWTDFVKIVQQSHEALIATHEQNLLHGDIKPSNFMLSWFPSGGFEVKMLDLGLLNLIRSRSQQEMETLKAAFGSFYFMPPEQFERLPLDCRSDIYSLGCVFYHALTAVYPFRGKTGHEIMTSHLNHAVTHLQELRSDIPPWVCDWVMWMINRYPKDRPESVRQSLSVFQQNYDSWLEWNP